MNLPLKISNEKLSQKLCEIGHTKTFFKNEAVFYLGDKAEFLPIILEGKIKIIRYLENGKEIIVNIFRDNEMFAIPPVYDGKEYPATAIAMEKSKLLLIYRKEFLAFLKESSEFSELIMSRMSFLLRETTSSIENLANSSSEKRVASVLLKLAKKEESKDFVKIPFRRQDIAEMSNLTTETTIRVVRKLADKNLIKIFHGKIYVKNLEKLKKFLD